MSAPSCRYAPSAPIQTPPPVVSSPPVAKRRRRNNNQPSTSKRTLRQSSSFLHVRDNITDEDQVNQAKQQCQVFSDNSVFSCFPTNNTVIPQHQLASFVWNSRLPQFTQTDSVNIYLFDAASGDIVHQWLRHPNPQSDAGVIRAAVNDTWFGPRGANWNGSNLTYLFYWVVTGPTDNVFLQGRPQPIFTAVQTTFADSIVASMSSSAAAASSSALQASLSSRTASLTSMSGSAPSVTPTASANPSVQGDNAAKPFPHWAIAVIVVLGVLALLASVILAFFILRRLRNRPSDTASTRNSMNSASPMMAHVQSGNTPQSPLLGGAALGGLAIGGGGGGGGGGGPMSAGTAGSHRATSPDVHDGASTISEGVLFSGADAAVMADAFRTALRKPNFGDRPVEEGESPEEAAGGNHPSELVMNRELAEEGRDIRSVGSSRGVKVETLSDHGTATTEAEADTIQDLHLHPH